MNTLLIIAIVYVAFCLFFYFFQDIFFFRPEILPSSFQYKYPFPFEEVDFEMEDGGKLNGIHFKVPNPRGVVYYLKGNSRSIKGWGKFAKDFVSNGYDFFMMDYRGFGKSTGKRNQETLFNDAQYVYDWIKKQYKEEDVVVFGRSLGSGIAARIASWNEPKMLVLDSPYFSFYYNIKRFLFFTPLKTLLRYKIRTDEYLKTTDCPVYIIHGTKDKLFPVNQSEKLKAAFPEKVELYKIKGGHHNDLPEFPEFFEILYEILYLNPEEKKQKG